MCKLETGPSITNKEDVRSMISALVFRQPYEYTENKIVALAKECLAGSAYAKLLDDYDLKQMVSKCLDISVRNNDVKCWNGKYRTTIADQF